MRKVWDIHGGVHPAENKTQSTQTPIGSITLPKKLILPLNQHLGAPAAACVQVGEKILAGQLVAEAQGYVSANVHAPTSGVISAIADRFIPHPSGMTAPCIEIQPDGEDNWITLDPSEDYTQLDRKVVLEKIRNAGIAGMGGAGFPSAVKLAPRAAIDTLILNGTECEPYITADDMLMRERAAEVIQGAQVLAYVLQQPKNIIIGIEDNKPEAIKAMQDAAKATEIEIAVFPTKYPSGGEKQLIQILTNKEVPNGKLPSDIGIVLQNIGTAVAAYRAVRFGEPLIKRITTVVGESLKNQRNIEVLIGTPMSHILAEHGFNNDDCSRLIVGGPMMGFAMEHTDIPVIKTTNCVLAPSKAEIPDPEPAQACIRCGMCAEVCPASLLPQQLFWYSQSEDFDRLQSHNLFDCIECGACSYVCPSNIPLVQYYRASKGTIRHIEEEKSKSDRSRERFEFRQERIAQAEIEKEAKRAARKIAAEEAKKKLAEQKANTHGSSESPVKPVDVDPVKQQAKLERALSSAESRMERATKSLGEAKEEGQEDRISSCEARLKQAELKVSEAKTKLEEFQSNSSTAPAEKTENKVKAKLQLSPIEQHEKAVNTIQKRLATAQQKLEEAERDNAPTVNAFKQGVEKLSEKLALSLKELNEAKLESSESQFQEQKTGEISTKEVSAADKAIEKAKAKAEAMSKMSDEEKTQAQIESLKGRLEKARDRLKKAEGEGNEHIDAFKAGVEKLEAKLAEAEQNR